MYFSVLQSLLVAHIIIYWLKLFVCCSFADHPLSLIIYLLWWFVGIQSNVVNISDVKHTYSLCDLIVLNEHHSAAVRSQWKRSHCALQSIRAELLPLSYTPKRQHAASCRIAHHLTVPGNEVKNKLQWQEGQDNIR